MHGPDEVAFTAQLFGRRGGSRPPENTPQSGHHGRGTLHHGQSLAAIKAAESRAVSINTGFLDRTGDEIHTSMEAGAVIRKGEMKQREAGSMPTRTPHVDTGLHAGPQWAQIGKGMWAMTDLMAQMVETKIGQPRAGATTAWVPSPTAATLHAMHHHQVDVFEVQNEIAKRDPASVDDILTIPWHRAPTDHRTRRRRRARQQLPVDPGRRPLIDHGVGCPRSPTSTTSRSYGGPRHPAHLQPAVGQLAPPRHRDRRRRGRRARTDGSCRRPAERRRPRLPADGTGLMSNIAFQAAKELIRRREGNPVYTEPILHRAPGAAGRPGLEPNHDRSAMYDWTRSAERQAVMTGPGRHLRLRDGGPGCSVGRPTAHGCSGVPLLDETRKAPGAGTAPEKRRSAPGRGVSRGLLFGIMSVMIVIAMVAAGQHFANKSDTEGDNAARSCVEGNLPVLIVADPDPSGADPEGRRRVHRYQSRDQDHCINVHVRAGDAKITLEGLTGTWDTASMGARPAARIPQSTIWSAELATVRPEAIEGTLTSRNHPPWCWQFIPGSG